MRPRRSTALFVLLGVFMAAACRSSAPVPPVAADIVVSGALMGRTGAYLTLGDAASRVRVVTAALPGQLYRISTPAGSGLAPVVVTGRDGRIRAALRPTGGAGPDEVRIVLNRAVRWDIRLPAGAGEQQLDLARGRVTRVDVGASGLVEMRLPRPAGTVPVTFLEDVGTVAFTMSADTPVRLRLAQGAGATVLPWPGDPAGAGVASPGWRTARDRYAVHARSAVGSLILNRLRPAAR